MKTISLAMKLVDNVSRPIKRIADNMDAVVKAANRLKKAGGDLDTVGQKIDEFGTNIGELESFHRVSEALRTDFRLIGKEIGLSSKELDGMARAAVRAERKLRQAAKVRFFQDTMPRIANHAQLALPAPKWTSLDDLPLESKFSRAFNKTKGVVSSFSSWTVGKLRGLSENIAGMNLIPDNFGLKGNPRGVIDQVSNAMVRLNSGIGNVIIRFGGVVGAVHPISGAVITVIGNVMKLGGVVQRLRGEVLNLSKSFATSLLPSFGGLQEIFSKIGWHLQTLAAATYFGKNVAGVVNNMMGNVDSYVSSMTRIQNILGEGETVEGIREGIRQASKESRMFYGDMLDDVTTLKLTTGDAFGTTDEAIKFATIISKSFQVAGTEAESQRSAMLQLRQALGSGVLQGDELRSILEGAPLLAKMLAKNLGYDSTGAMKSAASEGELTTDRVIAGILAAEDEINEMFDKMPMRWSDIMTRIRTEALFGFQDLFEKISGIINQQDLDAFFEKVEGKFRWIGSKGIELIDTITGIVEIFKTDPKAGITEAITQFGGALTFLFGVFKGGLVGNLFKFVGVWRMLNQVFGEDTFDNAITRMIDGLKNFDEIYPTFVENLVDGVVGIAETLRTRMPEIVDAFGDTLVGLFNTVGEHAPTLVNAVGSTLVSFLRDLSQREDILTSASEMIDAILGAMANWSGDIGFYLGTILTKIVTWFTDNKAKLYDGSDSVIGGFLDGLSESGLWEAVDPLLTSLVDDAISAAGTALKGIGGKIAESLINGFLDDLGTMGGSILDGLSWFWNDLILGGLGEDHSPSSYLIYPEVQEPVLPSNYGGTVKSAGTTVGQNSGQTITQGVSNELSQYLPSTMGNQMVNASLSAQQQASPQFTSTGHALGGDSAQGMTSAVGLMESSAMLFSLAGVQSAQSTSGLYDAAGNYLGKSTTTGYKGTRGDYRGAVVNTTTSGYEAVMRYVGLYSYSGEQLGLGVAQGMRSALPEVQAAASEIIRAANAAARHTAMIRSPSRLFKHTVGKMMGLGIADGMLMTIPTIENAAQRLIKAAEGAARYDLNQSISSVRSTIPDEKPEMSTNVAPELLARGKREFVQQYITNNHTPSIHLNGDVHETVDIDNMIAMIAQFLKESYQADLDLS